MLGSILDDWPDYARGSLYDRGLKESLCVQKVKAALQATVSVASPRLEDAGTFLGRVS
jgi:hypothetical protein